jgi:hypothetical protein
MMLPDIWVCCLSKHNRLSLLSSRGDHPQLLGGLIASIIVLVPRGY